MKRLLLAICLVFIVLPTEVLAEQKPILDCNKYKTNQLICSACNIYHEARGEHDNGKFAVALVTKNRVEADSRLFPNTTCSVVWETTTKRTTGRKVGMFSWTTNGKSDKVYDKKSWKKALVIAKKVQNNQVNDITNGAVYFHEVSVRPVWRKRCIQTTKIGAHVFYKLLT